MIKRGIFFAYLATLDLLCLLQWTDGYFNSFKIHKNMKTKHHKYFFVIACIILMQQSMIKNKEVLMFKILDVPHGYLSTAFSPS